jgi:hypothetical protein
MSRFKKLIYLVCCSCSIFTAKGEVLISEFLASNSSVLQDEDGKFSDWIEIHNTGTTS